MSQILKDSYDYHVCIFKLVTGETLVADAKPCRGGFECLNPMVMGFLIDPSTGMGELNLRKWLPFSAETGIKINKAAIIGTVLGDENLGKVYHSHVVRFQMSESKTKEELMEDAQNRAFEELLKDHKGTIN